MLSSDENKFHVPLATAEEEKQLSTMRERLESDFKAAPSARFEDVTGDIRLLRFLRGYDNDVTQAVAAVRDMLELRVRFNMDEAHEKWAHLDCHHETAGFPHQAAVNQFKPGIPTVGIGKHGHVIVYEPLRLHQYAAILDEIGEAGMHEFYLAQCESRMGQLQRLSVEQGQMVKMMCVCSALKPQRERERERERESYMRPSIQLDVCPLALILQLTQTHRIEPLCSQLDRRPAGRKSVAAVVASLDCVRLQVPDASEQDARRGSVEGACDQLPIVGHYRVEAHGGRWLDARGDAAQGEPARPWLPHLLRIRFGPTLLVIT